MKKTNQSIFRKLFLIIFTVFLAELILITLSLTLVSSKLVKDVTYIRLDDYLKNAQLLDNGEAGNEFLKETAGNYIEYVIISLAEEFEDSTFTITEGVNSLLSTTQLDRIIDEANRKASILKYEHGQVENNGIDIYYSFTLTNFNTIVIGICSEEYLNNSLFEVIFLVVILYALIFIAAAMITLVWAHLLVKRINKLNKFVTEMPDKEYKEVYIDEGNDELYNLSLQIEGMRKTIILDEAKKQAMLQNVSHDLKTPIAVIKSYTEAIEDGVEDLSSTKIIIEQCNKLEKKVKNFIEFNRLEYLNESTTEPIKIKEIIEKIVTNHKHISHVQILEDLDDSIFYGRYENYFTVCENIIENAVRYAVKVIKITLKDGILTIYNDGKHIDEKFIKEGFKAYEKGSEGKFGLGMSIVCRTLDIFNMKLEVKNEEVGVSFIIKPKDLK